MVEHLVLVPRIVVRTRLSRVRLGSTHETPVRVIVKRVRLQFTIDIPETTVEQHYF